MKFILFMLMILSLGCAGAASLGGTETGNTEDKVALAMGDSVDSVLVALRVAVGQGELSLTASAGGTCADSTQTISCSNTTNLASIAESFDEGCTFSSGLMIAGKRYTSWANMAEGSCPAEDERPYFSAAFRGTGAREIISTDVIPDSVTCNTPATAEVVTFSTGDTLAITACAEFDYSNYQEVDTVQSVLQELTLGYERRLRLNADGTTLYDHSISTPTALEINLAKDSADDYPTQTISSGVVTIANSTDQITTTAVFSDVKYDLNTCRCYPVSGTMTLSATESTTGESLGTGSITFTAATTGTCTSYDAVFNGANITLSLGSCGGS